MSCNNSTIKTRTQRKILGKNNEMDGWMKRLTESKVNKLGIVVYVSTMTKVAIKALLCLVIWLLTIFHNVILFHRLITTHPSTQ